MGSMEHVLVISGIMKYLTHLDVLHVILVVKHAVQI